jgi:hypothetical protein
MKRIILSSSLFVGVAAVVFVACTGDQATVTPLVDASTDGTLADAPVGNDGSTTDAASDDGGLVEIDGGTVTDGGGDPDPDGGVVIDAGSDAGTCGPPSGNGPSITSACSSNLILYQGGTIQTGTYDLVGFTISGTLQFCSTYVPASYAGKLVVTSTGKNAYRFDERVVRTNQIITNPNKSYTVTASGSTLTVAQTCGTAINDPTWSFSAGNVATDAGTKAGLTYTHASGTATVRYRWVHQ